jgi:hypothetical protein
MRSKFLQKVADTQVRTSSCGIAIAKIIKVARAHLSTTQINRSAHIKGKSNCFSDTVGAKNIFSAKSIFSRTFKVNLKYLELS